MLAELKLAAKSQAGKFYFLDTENKYEFMQTRRDWLLKQPLWKKRKDNKLRPSRSRNGNFNKNRMLLQPQRGGKLSERMCIFFLQSRSQSQLHYLRIRKTMELC